jgi:hypothetical protein
VTRIFVPSRGVEDWRIRLANPERQWQPGFSAKALACCWEEAKTTFPPSVRAAFAASRFPLFHKVELVLTLAEHTVPLPGRGRASQSDLFALGRSEDDLVSIAVEGKVAEVFDETIEVWLKRRAVDEEKRGRARVPSPGAQKRLRYLCEVVGLREEDVSDLRYQLIHRTASALIEARRFNARHALMLVHSFSQTKPPDCLEDFERFAERLQCEGAAAGTLAFVGPRDGIDLYLGWAKGDARFLTV